MLPKVRYVLMNMKLYASNRPDITMPEIMHKERKNQMFVRSFLRKTQVFASTFGVLIRKIEGIVLARLLAREATLLTTTILLLLGS